MLSTEELRQPFPPRFIPSWHDWFLGRAMLESFFSFDVSVLAATPFYFFFFPGYLIQLSSRIFVEGSVRCRDPWELPFPHFPPFCVRSVL